MEPRNSGKSAKSHEKTSKIPQNSLKILSNTCLHSIFETVFTYRKLANLSWNFATERANNVPKLPGIVNVAKKWALAMILRLSHWLISGAYLFLKEQMMTPVKNTLKMRSICNEICPEASHEISCFWPIVFWRSLLRKFPWNVCEIGWFFPEFVPQKSSKVDFFSTTYQMPCAVYVILESPT